MPRGIPNAKPVAKVRKDPPVKPVNTGTPYFQLINEDPTKSYIWVYKGAREHGVEYYQDYLGYLPVQAEAGGVRSRVGSQKKTGEFIEAMGHILMWVSKERAKEIEEVGADGQGGQVWADELEKRMYNSKAARADLARKQAFRSPEGSQYFEVESEKNSMASIPSGDD